MKDIVIRKDPEVIELRITPKTKKLYLLGAAVCVVFVLCTSLNLQGKDPSTVPSLGVLGAIIFAFVCWRTGRHGIGEIRLDDAGILIDTNQVVGRVSWDNFQKAGIFRPGEKANLDALFGAKVGAIAGGRLLGIAVADAESFIASRNNVHSSRARSASIISLANRAASAANIVQPQASIAPLFGLSDYPKTGSELDWMSWSRKNYGYNILIPLLGVINAEEIINRIERHRPKDANSSRTSINSGGANKANIASKQGLVNSTAPEGYKFCPMCAEPVRVNAKICRFCQAQL